MNSEFKIVFIITKLELGGAQKICLELFNHFSKDAFLISGASGILAAEVKNLPNFITNPYLERESSVFFVWKDLFAFIFLIRTLWQLKKKYPKLQVHTHSTKAGFFGRLAATLVGIKKIHHTVHGFNLNPSQSKLKKSFFWLFEQIGTWCSSSIICVSQKDLSTGSSIFWSFASKARLIRAAVDEEIFLSNQSTLKDEEAEILLGTISCFKPQKNLVDMILVCEKLRTLNLKFKLEIIGDGEQRGELERLIKSKNLSQNVFLLGWIVNLEQLVLTTKRWDVFLLTSLWEGLPCALVQARMQKLACVCYDSGGISEVLLDQKNGFLIPLFKKEIMVEKIKEMIQNKSLLASLKQHKDHLENFYLKNMLTLHQDLYDEF